MVMLMMLVVLVTLWLAASEVLMAVVVMLSDLRCWDSGGDCGD